MIFGVFQLPVTQNYGMDIGSGIVFSGSIPFLSVIFKLFGNFLPRDFHFFSLWILICFFLQSYISFLIIYSSYKKFDFFNSWITIFFNYHLFLFIEFHWHLSLSAHWLILLGFYIETKNESNKENFLLDSY